MSFSRLSRRVAWDLHRLGIFTRWLQWDISNLIHRCSSLPLETIWSQSYPPLSSDPYFVEPGLDWWDLTLNSPRNEFVRRLRHPVEIEPDFGYAIVNQRCLISDSLPCSEMSRHFSQMQYFSGVPVRNPRPSSGLQRTSRGPSAVENEPRLRFHAAPSVSGPAEAMGRSRSHRYEPRVVSLRFPFEWNYYHCYLDILSRLHILDLAGVDPAIPLIVGTELARQSYFQEMIRWGSLAERNWIVQDNFVIETDELIYASTCLGVSGHMDYLLDAIGAQPASQDASRRVFLTRSVGRGRYLTNMDELRPVLAEHHFEVIDTDGLPLDEQIALFSQTRFLVALHGAGLVNVAFRRGAPLTLVEVFSPSECSLCFRALSRQFGFQHDYLIGSDALNVTRQSPYRLDPAALRAKLKTITEGHSSQSMVPRELTTHV